MAYPIQLRARADAHGLRGRVLGRVTRVPVPEASRGDYFRAVDSGHPLTEGGNGYGAVLFCGTPTGELSSNFVTCYDSLDFLKEGYIAAVDLGTGFTRVLFRPDSWHNALFVTERCNSNCLMCSQPPKNVDDSGAADELIRLIDLLSEPPKHLGMTGGEPTLLRNGLVRVIARLKDRFPETPVTMLSNARLFADDDLTRKLAAVGHQAFLTSVPLYANNAADHDYVVQAKGAFDQTVVGLYNAAKYGLAVEIRVVLHKQTIPGLKALAEYVYRNLPFVQHVNLMGLENMGYVRKNWDLLWIDPVDYVRDLEDAVRHLHYRRIGVSIYNLPLCVLPEALWGVARQSISDFKNIYLPECGGCRLKQYCAGLFASSEHRHSRGIRAIA